MIYKGGGVKDDVGWVVRVEGRHMTIVRQEGSIETEGNFSYLEGD